MTDPTQTWMQHARCRGTNPETFFPEARQSAAPARKYCVRCPVTQPCLAYALDNNLSGVWGNTSGYDRRNMKQHDQSKTA